MTKKKITDQDRRDRIQPILDYWVPALALSDWHLTWEITDKIGAKTLGGGYMGGSLNASGPYQTAHMKLTRAAIDSCSLDSELEALIIHELCHCMLHPILTTVEKNVGGQSRVYEDVHWEVEKLLDSLAACFWALKDRESNLGGFTTALYSPLTRS